MKTQNLEILKIGFNVAMLAEAFNCSVGRINELKREPIEGEVYHAANINCAALYDFAVKHEIDLDAIDFETIVANAKKQKEAKTELTVGTKTSKGEIVDIQKAGNAFVYLVKANDGSLAIYTNKTLSE